MDNFNLPGKELVGRRIQLLFVVWLSMLGSIFLVGIIKESYIRDNMREFILTQPSMRWIFLLMGLFLLFVAYFVKKTLFNPEISGIQSTENKEKNLGHFIQKYVTAETIAMAIAESLSFIGFIAYTAGADNITFYEMIILSLAGLIYFKPSTQEFTSKLPYDIFQE